ncbi:MAG: hypothetical protein WDM85_00435 [Caulobacteraceae bacterium]
MPYVWFTDDNFLALKGEGEARPFYTLPRMQAALARAAAVWASTDALAAAHVWLHPHVGVWKPVLDPRLQQGAPAAPAGTLTVALSGGDFRLAGLAGAALEGLRRIAEGPGLRLVVTPAGGRLLRPLLPTAEIVVLPMERSFRQHVRALAPVPSGHPAAPGWRHRQRVFQDAHRRDCRRLSRGRPGCRG